MGLARKPPLWMRDGDVCEVEVDRIGVLTNPIRDRVPTNAPVRAAEPA